jgi:hypothetical protein
MGLYFGDLSMMPRPFRGQLPEGAIRSAADAAMPEAPRRQADLPVYNPPASTPSRDAQAAQTFGDSNMAPRLENEVRGMQALAGDTVGAVAAQEMTPAQQYMASALGSVDPEWTGKFASLPQHIATLTEQVGKYHG